ncbi:hypothetical protein [Streptomyces griseus]|uniref:hypothetical protein n=1 Tax=Streptomyces griseus TaxID=1911 RepID=UPI0036FEBF77
MAIEHLIPAPAPNDLMSLPMVYEFLRQTGHPASRETIRRWIKRADARGEAMHTERRRFPGYRRYYVYVSLSDILMAHRDWMQTKGADEP